MKVSVSDLGDMGVTEVIIESVDLSLYIAHARIDDEEHVIADRQGKVLKTRNLLEMQRMLRRAVTCEFFLRQRSAYDEMVGHAHQAEITVWNYLWGASHCPNGSIRGRRVGG